MAFTGTATVVQVSDSIVRITGLSLGAGADGTIGLFDNSGTPGVRLPASFQPKPYAFNGQDVSLSDMIDVQEKAAAVGTPTAIPVAVVKTGTVPADWVATLTNTHATTATPNLEIYVRIHE